MSKPDNPGELRGVDVVSVSLVSRAANKLFPDTRG